MTSYNTSLAENSSCLYGLILPVLNDDEWNPVVRTILYLAGMLWCFLGVAIVADVFMCSIERITSKTRKVLIADENSETGYQEVEVRVWNDTVANLSLLAMGTSAPEILLSVIEILGNKFKAGELGPSTIVGSAAFNLLCITAICIVAIPAGEVRRIKSFKVYIVTAISCIWAYVWLIIVLLVSSPNEVELWEAIITLLFFPTLIVIAYLADRNCCIGKQKSHEVNNVEIGLNTKAAMDEEEQTEGIDRKDVGRSSIISIAQDLGKHKELSDKKAAKLAAYKLSEDKGHDRGWHRIAATRSITGGKRLLPMAVNAFRQLHSEVQMTEEEKNSPMAKLIRLDLGEGGTKPVVEFTAASCAVLESDKKVRVGIKRYGKMNVPVTVTVETIDGTALANEDYKPVKQNLTFVENEKLKELYVEIIDDYEWEPDEFFFVKLSLPKDSEAVVGNISINQVTIIDDDEPGKLEFGSPSYVVKESERKALIPVRRFNGADGHVSIKWRSKSMSAVDGKHFKGGDGLLEFAHGETIKMIEIPIITTQEPERDDSFQLELSDTTGGAEIGRLARTIVTIVNDDEFDGLVSRIVNMTVASLDVLRLDTGSWADQFHDAMNVNGGEVDEATAFDYIMHFMTFWWKVFFAFIPPTSIGGGWLTFIISLSVIGLLTAIIGDLATVFGCLIGLKPSVTAITFVALGTSMPDTFASKTAATMEKTADSSVGNVTGSNSVNVFLGLGLPWVIAAIYWTAKGEPFEVKAGSLGFSVVLYTVAAVLAIVLLFLRRKLALFGNAELGGPFGPKVVSAIVVFFLWIMYVVLASLQAHDHIQGF
ncbi:sodium/calcium exchanger 2-like [Liolophura sinensis]|uniref:sodium/calcium exchanger 2-like n=1 Tax=Liolophura sinensis TaxID=3198878 RepID=UPI0031592748